MVAVSSVIKRFVWLAQRLKIFAFARYLWLVDYKILPILTYYNIIKILKHTIVIKYNNYQYNMINNNMINNNIMFIYLIFKLVEVLILINFFEDLY